MLSIIDLVWIRNAVMYSLVDFVMILLDLFYDSILNIAIEHKIFTLNSFNINEL